MEEPGHPAAPVAPVAPAEPVAPVIPDGPKSFINEDGTLAEGWRGKYLPEDLREAKVYDKITNLNSAFTQIGHLDKLVGKKGILLPTESSGQSEWDEFWNETGRPSTSDGYQYAEPDDISSEDLSPENMKEFFEGAHKVGYTQKHIDYAIGFYVDHLREIEKSVNDAEERDKLEAKMALETKWGAAYQERLHLANRAISEHSTSEEMQTHIVKRMGNDPIMGDFFANMQMNFQEHRSDPTDIDTPSADATAKIAELMKSPAYSDPNYADRAEHKRVVDMVQELLRQQSVRKGTPA